MDAEGSSHGPRISIVLPVFNEESNLPGCLAALHRTLEGTLYEIVVVDDGSSDRSREVAHALATERPECIRVIAHETNRGLGGALQTGFDMATADYVTCCPADFPMTPADWAPFAGALGSADVIVGCRIRREGYNPLMRFNSWLYHRLVAVLFDADLKSYFDTIPHDRLLARVAERGSDGRVLSLISGFLKQGVLDGLHEWTPEAGSPQDAVVSPLLSNIYLNPLDHQMAQEGFEMVRYADDFVILCRSAGDAARALERVRDWVADNGLTLHPTKTRVLDARTEGFDFLGYRFEGGTRRPGAKSLGKFKDAIRAKTRRTGGDSLSWIITDVNRTLRGWLEYFKHSHRWTFAPLDRWLRRRLRTLLRRRLGLRDPSRGADSFRWPNAFFAERGLFSLSAAHATARQPSTR